MFGAKLCPGLWVQGADNSMDRCSNVNRRSIIKGRKRSVACVNYSYDVISCKISVSLNDIRWLLCCRDCVVASENQRIKSIELGWLSFQLQGYLLPWCDWTIDRSLFGFVMIKGLLHYWDNADWYIAVFQQWFKKWVGDCSYGAM